MEVETTVTEWDSLTPSEAVSFVPPQPGGAHHILVVSVARGVRGGRSSDAWSCCLWELASAQGLCGRHSRAGAGGWGLPQFLVLCLGSSAPPEGGGCGPEDQAASWRSVAPSIPALSELWAEALVGWVCGVGPPPAQGSCCLPHARGCWELPWGWGAVRWFLLSHSEVPRCLFQSRKLKIEENRS